MSRGGQRRASDATSGADLVSWLRRRNRRRIETGAVAANGDGYSILSGDTPSALGAAPSFAVALPLGDPAPPGVAAVSGLTLGVSGGDGFRLVTSGIWLVKVNVRVEMAGAGAFPDGEHPRLYLGDEAALLDDQTLMPTTWADAGSNAFYATGMTVVTSALGIPMGIALAWGWDTGGADVGATVDETFWTFARVADTTGTGA